MKKCEHDWVFHGYELRPGSADCDVNVFMDPTPALQCTKCRRFMTSAEFKRLEEAATRGEKITLE